MYLFSISHLLFLLISISKTRAGVMDIRTTVASSNLVHEFPIYTWVENIRVRQNGQLILSTATTPDVYIVDPSVSTSDPTSTTTGVQLLHNFSSYALAMGLTETYPDQFYAIVGKTSSDGFGTGTYTVWSLNLDKYNFTSNTGLQTNKVADFPDAGMLNGMDTLDVTKGLLVITDSTMGVIRLLNINDGTSRVLLDEPEMKGTGTTGADAIGINGLKVLQDGGITYIYFSNTIRNTFCRIPIYTSTLEKSGPVDVLQTGHKVDDFALDSIKQVAYLAGSIDNTLYQISLNGGPVTTILGGKNDTILPGPTSAALGRGCAEGQVYVTTSGGLSAPIDGTYTEGGKVLAVVPVL